MSMILSPDDLTAIKARLAEWKRLRAASPGGYLKVRKGSESAFPAVDFIVYAHNTPIEDDIEALLNYIELLEGRV